MLIPQYALPIKFSYFLFSKAILIACLLALTPLSANAGLLGDLKKAERKCKITFDKVEKGRIWPLNNKIKQDYDNIVRSGKETSKSVEKFINSNLCSKNEVGMLMWIHTPKSNSMVCYEKPEAMIKNLNIVKSNNGLDKKIGELQTNCTNYYRSHFFESKLAALKEQENKALLARKAQQEKARKAKEAKAKKAQKNNADLFAALAKYSTNGKHIIWDKSLSEKEIKDGENSPNRHLNNMNMEIIHATDASAMTAPFDMPVKGEFEKTTDYEKRVANAKAAHQAEVDKLQSDIRNNTQAIKQNTLNQYMGDPIISSVIYDADSESYEITIRSSSVKYELSSKYKVPIDKAKAMKDEITKSKPAVLFVEMQDELKPVGVGLLMGNDAITTNKSISTSVKIPSGNKALQEWETQLKKEKTERMAEQKARDVKLEKERKERAIKYNHNGSFLSKGAYVCTSLNSIFKMITTRKIGYAQDPADCYISSYDIQPITDVKHLNGGVSMATIKGVGQRIYTPTGDILF